MGKLLKPLNITIKRVAGDGHYQSGPKLFGMLNFEHFTLFPIVSHQSGPK